MSSVHFYFVIFLLFHFHFILYIFIHSKFCLASSYTHSFFVLFATHTLSSCHVSISTLSFCLLFCHFVSFPFVNTFISIFPPFTHSHFVILPSMHFLFIFFPIYTLLFIFLTSKHFPFCLFVIYTLSFRLASIYALSFRHIFPRPRVRQHRPSVIHGTSLQASARVLLQQFPSLTLWLRSLGGWLARRGIRAQAIRHICKRTVVAADGGCGGCGGDKLMQPP